MPTERFPLTHFGFVYRGKKLVITATGTLSEDVDEDAKIHLQVKYGLIRILDYEATLCDYVGEVDLKCPIKKGDLNLTKSVDLPSRIPRVSLHLVTFLDPSPPHLCLHAM